jgi:nickel-dependent lactate racemase
MPIAVEYGRRRLELEIDPGRLIGSYHGPDPLADPVEAVRRALEAPTGYPPLRQALTPDDHVAVVIDARYPHLGELLVPLLDHLISASVVPEAISLVCAEHEQLLDWLDELPERLEDVHVEEHDPKDRHQLAYLATTKAGRRLYLNRTLVDADCIVALTERRYDLVMGYAGAEAAFFPRLSDEATREELGKEFHAEEPTKKPFPAHAEAIEVAWLLGQPFYVQLLAGRGDGLAQVMTGAAEAARSAEHWLDEHWKAHLPRRADLVLVALSGDPARHTFADLASAAASASRVVQTGGRIVLLCEATPHLGPDVQMLLRADDPQTAAKELLRAGSVHRGPALQWASAVAHARVSLLSGLPGQTVEDLFATPLDDEAQARRLVSAGGEIAILHDGQRMRTTFD